MYYALLKLFCLPLLHLVTQMNLPRNAESRAGDPPSETKPTSGYVLVVTNLPPEKM